MSGRETSPEAPGPFLEEPEKVIREGREEAGEKEPEGHILEQLNDHITGQKPVPQSIEEPKVAYLMPRNRFFPPEDRALSILRTLSLRQKIGQRFIGYLPAAEVTEEAKTLIRSGEIGGFILYKKNFETFAGAVAITEELNQEAAAGDLPVKLFLATDQEGGRVAALRLKETTQLPPAYYWSLYRDPAYVRAAAYITGKELSNLGFNMNFAPVLDVYETPDSSIIGDRSFGDDPFITAELGKAYIETLQSLGIIAVPKHFPGHGVTDVDSHGNLPVVGKNRDELEAWDMAPFRTVIENGADAIMTAHILYTDIDPLYPATLSEAIIKGILKERLKFKGVVISDGFSMGALSKQFSVDEALYASFTAGIDIILVHAKYDVGTLITLVEAMVNGGLIRTEEIDRGAYQVLKLKEKYGLLIDPFL